MSSPILEERLDAYERFHDAAENMVIAFGTKDILCSEVQEDNMDEVIDDFDELYLEDESTLSYKELRVISAIAMIDRAEIKVLRVAIPEEKDLYD